MAAPWEDTVVMALRDAQWLNDDSGDVPKLPQMFIKLSGKTEQSLGDLVYQAGERFYLFEVKSSAATITSEWNKTVDGKPHPKLAFKTLSRLARAVAQKQCAIEEIQAFWTSLRCHHIVYWSDALFDPFDTLGNIFIEPYIGACVHHGAPRGTGILEVPKLAIQTASIEANNQLLVSPMLPLSSVRNRTGIVLVEDDRCGLDSNRMATVGEDLCRFRNYLQFLVDAGGVGDGSIHAVICSDSGRFAKLITSVQQLAQELKPNSGPSSEPPQILPRRAAPQPPDFQELVLARPPAPRSNFPNYSPPAPRIRSPSP